MSLLEVRDLTVEFGQRGGGQFRAVDGLSFALTAETADSYVAPPITSEEIADACVCVTAAASCSPDCNAAMSAVSNQSSEPSGISTNCARAEHAERHVERIVMSTMRRTAGV